MSPTALAERELVEALGRAVIYQLAAVGMAWPTPQRRSGLEDVLIPAIVGLELPGGLGDLVEALREGPGELEGLRAGHITLFPPVVSSDAPGYETAYRGGEIFRQADLLADIAGFYRAHGLRAGGEEKERLDHIVVECEFMSLLARKEAAALGAGDTARVTVCRETSAFFLRDHLACWAPAFGRRAASVAAHLWHRRLGALLAGWVEADLAAYGYEPVEVVDEPLPQEPPDDGVCGPCPLPGGGSG